jgi:sarcosine oxidase
MESDPGFVVCGLGAFGAAALYQLAKRGAKAVGIDRHSPPHALGSSHGDTRITRQAIGEGEWYTPIVLRSHEIWREIERESGEKLLEVTGGLVISSPARRATTHVEGFFENTLAAAKRFGIPHEILDAAAIRKRFPQFNVRDNEVGYYEPGAGFVRPEACIRAQLALAERHGATIHRDEAVRGFWSANGIVHAVTDHGVHRARALLLCAGAWLPRFLEPQVANLFKVSRQALHWFTVEAPIERYTAPQFPVWIWELQDSRHVIYGFPATEGVAGGVKVATEQYETTTTPESVDRDVSEEESRRMHAALIAPNLPELGSRRVKAAACLYTVTPDFHFAIDRHPRVPEAILVSPCSGHGFKHSAAIGEALAELALEGRSHIDLAPFGFRRFQRTF